MRDFKGKVAVVTGGGGTGIGNALVVELARAGAQVAFCDIAHLDKTERDIAGFDAPHFAATVDMAERSQIDAFIAEVIARFGHIDLLVNNAGIQHVEKIEDFPIDKWDRIIAINLSSSFHTMRAAIPLMKAKGKGRIVNIASAHALIASPFKAAYVAAKHGVMGLTKTVALEVAENRITANTICPGYVLTPIVEAQIPDQMKTHKMSREDVIAKVMLSRQPSGEFATVEQMGGTAVFLCSDAAAQITGTTISVDGGWTAM